MNELRKFYRVGDMNGNQGLWYDMNGNYIGLIHSKFSFCKNRDLPMPFDKNIIGYMSVVGNLSDLFTWFTVQDIRELEKYGYRVFEYVSNDYKPYNNHFVINKLNYKLERILKL